MRSRGMRRWERWCSQVGRRLLRVSTRDDAFFSALPFFFPFLLLLRPCLLPPVLFSSFSACFSSPSVQLRPPHRPPPFPCSIVIPTTQNLLHTTHPSSSFSAFLPSPSLHVHP